MFDTCKETMWNTIVVVVLEVYATGKAEMFPDEYSDKTFHFQQMNVKTAL